MKPDRSGMKRELARSERGAASIWNNAAIRFSSNWRRLPRSCVLTEQAQEELTAKQRESERSHFAAKHRHEQTQSDLARLGLDLGVVQNELRQRAQRY